MGPHALPRAYPLERLHKALIASELTSPLAVRLLRGAPVVAEGRVQVLTAVHVHERRAGLVVEASPASMGVLAAVLGRLLGVQDRALHLSTHMDGSGRVLELWGNAERPLAQWCSPASRPGEAAPSMMPPRHLRALAGYTDDIVPALWAVLDLEVTGRLAGATEASGRAA